MTTLHTATLSSAGYGARFAALIWQGVAQVIRPASHSRRAQAARAWARRTLLLALSAAAVIAVLMIWIDAREITWMPPRGTASLWPVRIVTDFGKANYVIGTLLFALLGVVLLAPRVKGVSHAILVAVAARLQYLFLAVVLSNLVGEALKGIVGRGRPFVGGEANAFNFAHFAWNEAYASFPSGHATTSCALAFAVSALWPRLRLAVLIFAVVILTSRLVLLAHHPSDVIGGAMLGVIGAMVMRYWFAARRVVFVILPDGGIVARHGPSAAAVARAFRRALTV